MNKLHAAVGAGTLALGALIAAGAVGIRSDAGYGGVGPNFLPWVVGLALLACGVMLVREALTGGFQQMDEPSGDAHGHWPGFVWVSAGLLLTAGLITRIGFVLACGLCFMFAVRGFRSAEGRMDMSPKSWILDLLTGMAIAAPVYWMFGKLLAINLPGLTAGGWI